MFTGGNLWLTVGLISLAAAAHQGWSANLFTLPSDTFPRQAVGSVVGLGGMGDFWRHARCTAHRNMAGLFAQIAAGSMYLIALLVIHLLLPRIRQVEFPIISPAS